MPFVFKGTTVKKLNFNGTAMKKHIANGVQVWSAEYNALAEGGWTTKSTYSDVTITTSTYTVLCT